MKQPMKTFTWMAELGRAGFLWLEQGDEWLHRFRAQLEQQGSRFRYLGWRHDESTQPFIALRLYLNGKDTDVAILIGLTPSEVIFLAAGNDTSPEEELLAELAGYCRTVTESLGTEGELHKWSALIGYPRSRIGGIERRLDRTTVIGPFRLESSDVIYTETDSMFQVSLSGWSPHAQVPIRVFGEHRGYSFEAAAARAAHELHRLCGLLSVACGECIVVRDSIRALDWGVTPVPRHSPWEDWNGIDQDVSLEGIAPLELPNWLENAWTGVADETWIGRAVDAFHEGLRLSPEHPSMALVALIASIEAISDRLFKTPRCSTCASHTRITEKFRRTLHFAVDEDEAGLLAAAYSPRSRTVHSGQFHGGEQQAGIVIMPPVWGKDPVVEFRWTLLRKMASAARKLLITALTDGLPDRIEIEAST